MLVVGCSVAPYGEFMFWVLEVCGVRGCCVGDDREGLMGMCL